MSPYVNIFAQVQKKNILHEKYQLIQAWRSISVHSSSEFTINANCAHH